MSDFVLAAILPEMLIWMVAGLSPYVATFLEYRGVTSGTTNPVWATVWDEILEHGVADRLSE